MRRFTLAGLAAAAAVLSGVGLVASASGPASASSGSAAAWHSSPWSPVTALSALTRTPLRAQAGAVPTGIEDTRISCGTGKSCLVVGATINPNTGVSVPYAKAWNGTSWKPVAVHLPKGMSATGSALTGVHCKSATSCLVAGANAANAGTGRTRPFALAWHGTALFPVAAPVLPSVASDGFLTDLSCLALKNCVGVGVSFTKSGVSHPFIESWNGTKWTLRLTWSASATTLLQFGGVSCASPTFCVVAGEGAAKTGGVVPYLARWNGKTLTRMPVPVPAGVKNSLIGGVSCTSAVNCAATGASLTPSSASQAIGLAFVENWNGKAWTATKLAWPAGTGSSVLLGVSCTFSSAAGRHCLATGATESGSASSAASSAAAVTWNGKTWSLTHVPAPGAGKSSDLEDVSCVSAVSCFAAGLDGPTSGTSARPLAGFWNGSAWKLAVT